MRSRLIVRGEDEADTDPATDWSSGPPAQVVMSCGHTVTYRPPSPARGDLLTCGHCGEVTVVEKPIRRHDRHAPLLTKAEVLDDSDDEWLDLPFPVIPRKGRPTAPAELAELTYRVSNLHADDWRSWPLPPETPPPLARLRPLPPEYEIPTMTTTPTRVRPPAPKVRRGAQSDDWLKLSFDRKVTPRSYWQPGGVTGGRWVAVVANSFGLPAGTTCPGKTTFCRSCYARNSEKSKGVGALVEHNYRMLLEAGTIDGMTELLVEMIGRYEDHVDRVGVPQRERIFRVHWDGDFFSVDYARAWAETASRFPDVQFWAYTRSFVEPVDVVPVLVGLPNFTLYLSVDVENAEAAEAMAAEYPSLLLAGCAGDFAHAAELIPARTKVAVPCPENDGRLPLIGPDRHHEEAVGACVTCQLCPAGRRDILFAPVTIKRGRR